MGCYAPTMDRAQILEAVGRVARDLAFADLDLVVVFGSVAAARETPSSDVDVFVRLAAGAPLDHVRHRELENALSAATRREVDVVSDGPRTSVVLRHQVAAKGIPVYERVPRAFKDFVVDAIRAYVDLEPQLRLLSAATRARAIRDGAAALRQFGGNVGR